MKLQEILSISGQPGLFRYIARSRGGVIVESLADGKRTNASGSSKISSLAEIAIYTDAEDMPLWKVFESIRNHTEGKPAISHKSEPNQLKRFFAEVLPDYDRERVHVSDIKKVVAWYNILTEAGMTDFSIEEEQETPEE